MQTRVLNLSGLNSLEVVWRNDKQLYSLSFDLKASNLSNQPLYSEGLVKFHQRRLRNMTNVCMYFFRKMPGLTNLLTLNGLKIY